MKGRIYEAPADFQLEAPSRADWGGSPFVRGRTGSFWEVPVLVRMYPTEPKVEVTATVQFLFPGEQKHAEIEEFGTFQFLRFQATIFESDHKSFNDIVCREWSAMFQSSTGDKSRCTLGWDPDMVYEELTSWIQYVTREQVERIIRRVDGHKNTSSVTVDYYWQLQAGG